MKKKNDSVVMKCKKCGKSTLFRHPVLWPFLEYFGRYEMTGNKVKVSEFLEGSLSNKKAELGKYTCSCCKKLKK